MLEGISHLNPTLFSVKEQNNEKELATKKFENFIIQ